MFEVKMSEVKNLPVAVIGSGPIGLTAAAHLVDRGLEPLIFESGSRIAAGMRDWGHVRLFTPWSYLMDPVGRRLLEASGDWHAPNEQDVPYALELVEQFLEPLAGLESIAPHLRLDHRVTAIARDGHDRMANGRRDESPFLMVAQTPDGPKRYKVAQVIDASGTWTSPNPLGAAGVPADGEEEHQNAIRYGMPDVLGRERERYAGKRVLVVGSGHSAIGTVLSLVDLAGKTEPDEPETLIAWAVRRKDPRKLWGGGEADELSERGRLGTRVAEAVSSGAVTLLTGLSIGALRDRADGIEVVDVDGAPQLVVDEIVGATGSRPDFSTLRELRLELDTATESASKIGPLIDPNFHSCGSVPPHGVDELAHPEKGFFIVGMKSYGRAPTFLMRTGFEQVRSIVAELAGDADAARRVELQLPTTGVCNTDFAFSA